MSSWSSFLRSSLLQLFFLPSGHWTNQATLGSVLSLFFCLDKSWFLNLEPHTVFILPFFWVQNPTLEHYTTFKASDLKASVHALQDLQLNIKGCSLASIRMKYKQEKVKKIIQVSSSVDFCYFTYFCYYSSNPWRFCLLRSYLTGYSE